jgi:hypothetical protein
MPIRGLQSQHRAMPQLTSHVCPSLAPPPPRPQLWIRCDVLPICPQSSSSNARLWWIRPRVSSLHLFLLHRGYRLRESGARAGGRHEDHLRDSPPTSRETCSDQPRQPPPLLSSPDPPAPAHRQEEDPHPHAARPAFRHVLNRLLVVVSRSTDPALLSPSVPSAHACMPYARWNAYVARALTWSCSRMPPRPGLPLCSLHWFLLCMHAAC